VSQLALPSVNSTAGVEAAVCSVGPDVIVILRTSSEAFPTRVFSFDFARAVIVSTITWLADRVRSASSD